MTHTFTISEKRANEILEGRNATIANGHYGFQKGDRLKFEILLGRETFEHPLDGKEFEITFVLIDEGLEKGYVVLCFKEVKEDATEHVYAWALKDANGAYINSVTVDSDFSKALLFRGEKEALEWLKAWRKKSKKDYTPVKVLLNEVKE